jgi:DNA topoisomerase VI B subunit
MPPKSSSKKSLNSRGEVLTVRSPAEFFAENQNIAGFDNPGKSLFTTIRELTENSLDAAESINVLPNISITVEQISQEDLNKQQGLGVHERVDEKLYKKADSPKKKLSKAAAAAAAAAAAGADDDADGAGMGAGSKTTAAAAAAAVTTNKAGGAGAAGRDKTSFYRITCTDNGAGMKHEKIPDMFGRVLAGSKYGVRQTRGKFGLGAKMALIWSKKSTGLPIVIRSAHSTDPRRAPAHSSHYTLDIDIHRNEPNVRQVEKRPAPTAAAGGGAAPIVRGSTVSLTIGGNWTTYKSKIIRYLEQLAIITPYAQLDLSYECLSNAKTNFSIQYARRSEQMPPLPTEVKHHPSSVNDLLLKQLLRRSAGRSVKAFLSSDLSSIDAKMANRLLAEFGAKEGFAADMKCDGVTDKQVHRMTQVMKQVKFAPPDGGALSPAGEYNLRLGILKEIQPEKTAMGEHLVATHQEKPAVFEGHSFVVEGGVSLGAAQGHATMKEGLNVHRFANRIPLLFEGGADVATQVAQKQIKWSAYKIDHKKEKVGVFISIVSTKIPFKGTGKEYIGSDIEEIKKAVKHCLQQCCSQLKTKLVKRSQAKEQANRRKNLIRYVPDVSRAFVGIIESMQKRKREEEDAAAAVVVGAVGGGGGGAAEGAERKRQRKDDFFMSEYQEMQTRTLARLDRGEISVKVLEQKLEGAIDVGEEEAQRASTAAGKAKGGALQAVFLTPLAKTSGSMFLHDLMHPSGNCFRLLADCQTLPSSSSKSKSKSGGGKSPMGRSSTV